MVEVIVLERLKDLPKDVGMLQKSPVEDVEEARAWGVMWSAETVYYWKRTLSAFIVKEQG